MVTQLVARQLVLGLKYVPGPMEVPEIKTEKSITDLKQVPSLD